MPRRHLLLPYLFSERFCAYAAGLTQSCIFIGVLTLFSQFTLTQQQQFGEIPKDIAQTEYTLLTAPKIGHNAKLYYAIVVGDSPTAVILNKNYEIIKEVPASIFTSKTSDIKSEVKSNLNAKIHSPNLQNKGINHGSDIVATQDTTSLRQSKTETFPPTSYSGNVALQTGELQGNAEKETSETLSNNLIPYTNIQNGRLQINLDNNSTTKSPEVRTESVADLLLRAAEERLRELGFGTSNHGGTGNGNNIEHINPTHAQFSELPNVKLSSARLNLVENVEDRRKQNHFVDTNENINSIQMLSSNPRNIDPSTPKYNRHENMDSKRKQMHLNKIMDTYEIVRQPSPTRTPENLHFRTPAVTPTLNIADTIENKRKQRFSNRLMDTYDNTQPSSKPQSADISYIRTLTPSLSLAESMETKTKRTLINANENANSLRNQTSELPNIKISTSKLNSVENIGNDMTQALSNKFINTYENVHYRQTQLHNIGESKSKLTEKVGSGRKQTHSKSVIEKLLWTPEDIGKRRVIKQQEANHRRVIKQHGANHSRVIKQQKANQKISRKQVVTNPLVDSADIVQTKRKVEVKIPMNTNHSAGNSQFETYLRTYFDEQMNTNNLNIKTNNGGSVKAAKKVNDPNLTALPMDEISRFPSNLGSKVPSPDFAGSKKFATQQKRTGQDNGSTNKIMGVTKTQKYLNHI